MERGSAIPTPAKKLILFFWASFLFQEKFHNAQVPDDFKLEWRQIATLADREIHESSGIVLSQINSDCFWTHNDSGDAPRLFLVHRDGRTVGRLKVTGAKAIDWEDIALATIDGQPKLVVGDIGGNTQRRKNVVLYILSEPVFAIDGLNPLAATDATVAVETTLEISFAGGVTNYEGIAFDSTTKSIVIFEKALFGGRVYSVPFPKLPKVVGSAALKEELEATMLGRSSIPYACGCDVSSDGKSMVIVTYGTGFMIKRQNNDQGELESWAEALKREPLSFPLPKVRQAEAVCFSADSKSIFITSEQLPTPLFEGKLPQAKK